MDLLEFFLLRDIFGKRSVDINIYDTREQQEPTSMITQCEEEDYKLYYGQINTYYYCGDNFFKLTSTEKISNKEYSEINLDDILYIRTYENEQDKFYYSTNRKEWKKSDSEWYFSREGRYIQFSDSIMKIYNNIVE